MPDNILPGAMTMVKINGAKVKALRENQGLTQLYLATAVQVTTDTISRWENKRYPSIKKENGLKLAESLGVELEDILEKVSDAPEKIVPDDDIASAHLPENRSNIRIKKSRSILAAVILLITGICFWLYLSIISVPAVSILAERTLPSHYISGQPFPVIITVTGPPVDSTALILKENLPANVTVISTVPKITDAGMRNGKIKWLKKIEHTAIFSYLVTINGKLNKSVTFSGNVASNRGTTDSLQISGDSTISAAKYHWADSNGDNIINDNEILTVYDRYSEIDGLGLNIDLIEEIWLGSGYRWNDKTSAFDIFE